MSRESFQASKLGNTLVTANKSDSQATDEDLLSLPKQCWAKPDSSAAGGMVAMDTYHLIQTREHDDDTPPDKNNR